MQGSDCCLVYGNFSQKDEQGAQMSFYGLYNLLDAHLAAMKGGQGKAESNLSGFSYFLLLIFDQVHENVPHSDIFPFFLLLLTNIFPPLTGRRT